MAASVQMQANISAVRPVREIARLEGEQPGSTLIAIGSIHGNEPGGMIALKRVANHLERSNIKLRGRILFLTGNLRASAEGVRFIDSDLNRHWTTENVRKNSSERDGLSEDAEQYQLLGILRELLRTARDEVFVLDLHSTSADGRPFATVGDTMRNRRFALGFPLTILLGIEEQLDGTLLEFLNNEGAVTLGFEGGQHLAASTSENHEALVYCALVNTGIIDRSDLPGSDRYAARLSKVSGRARVFEVRHREPVGPNDDFSMRPGFSNFDPVRKGQVLADNRFGTIVSPETGLILMPLYQKLGEDGFFIVREVARVWLWISAVLRSMNVARFMTLLPGVRQTAAGAARLEINTRIARVFPLQIFHLLGFRRLRWADDRLVVSRRRFDTASPFRRQEGRHGH